MDEKEKKKIEDIALHGGALVALDWVIAILKGNSEYLNLKNLDNKCNEVRDLAKQLKGQ